MVTLFIEALGFTRRITEFLDDEAYRRFQNELQRNPNKGEVMPGCGGLRKVRLESPRRNKGKRGGFRVVYLHVPEAKRIYFLAIYGKNEQDDLSAEQKCQLRSLAENIKGVLHRQRQFY